ncbi:MAG: choice-of-anchor Q domain-containing protein [Limisphaerales bacterium]
MKIKAFGITLALTLCFCVLITTAAQAVSYTLAVGAQGSGIVAKNPNIASFPAGVTVTITATPNAGWYFANWSGDTNGSVNPLNVTMNANLVITGNFLAYATYALTLVTNGQGTITLSPAGGTYLSNSTVTATALPAAGWVFTGWSGATNTSVNPLPLTLNANVSLTGNFAQLPAFDLQPVGVTNTVGSTVNFTGHSVGTAPLSYQWFFSGGSLNNATSPTLTLTNTTLNQAGNYWLVATNNYGSATSSVVKLVLTNGSGSTNVVSSPDEASLRAAIQVGGWVSLAFNGTLTLTNTIVITNNVILDASGVSAIISGGNAVRLLYIAPGANLSATNLILANGLAFTTGSLIFTNGTTVMPADGGAIYNNGGIVNLVGCTATNNSAQSLIVGGLARGGAIFNNGGTTWLFQSVFTNNFAIAGGTNGAIAAVATNSGLGGAVYNTSGSLTIADCDVRGNFCQGLWATVVAYIRDNSGFYHQTIANGTGLTMGGAVFQDSGALTVLNSRFEINRAIGGDGPVSQTSGVIASPAFGGALAITGGSTIIDHSKFSANTSKGGDAGFHGGAGQASGGAIYSGAALTLTESSLTGNQSLAGIGTAVPQGGTKGVDGFGGAIYNAGTAVLNRCAVYSNSAQGGSAYAYINTRANGGHGLGGGIFNASQFAATNSTLAFNMANGGTGQSNPNGLDGALGGNGFGGGVFNNSNATFIAMNLTIASNSCSSPAGFGFTNGIAAGSQIANTNGTLRLHNSAIAGTNFNAYGPITDDGFNICSDGTAQLFGGSSFNFTDPKVGPLANYGGPTLCMSLLPDSPAIDYADISSFPPTDQRGYIRPISDGPDVGAFEYGSHPADVPYLNIASTSGILTLSFTAAPSKIYVLQSSANFSTWANLNTNGPYATSTNINQTISTQGSDVRFFRLLVN